MILTYRYVRMDQIEAFLQMGWLLGPFASHHSIFMFACICNVDGKAPQ